MYICIDFNLIVWSVYNQQSNIAVLSIDNAPNDKIVHIGGDVFLVEDIGPNGIMFSDEFVVSDYMVYYLRDGRVRGKSNGFRTDYASPMMIILQPGEVYSFDKASIDVHGSLIVYSREFSENLNVLYHFRLNAALRQQSALQIDDEAKDVMQDYYRQLKRIASYADNPFRIEAALHLTRAFFYGIGCYYYNTRNILNLNTRNREIADEFLELVEQFGSRERKMEFYSDKMRLSIKYISSAVLRETGHTTSFWIEQATIHEAQRLLTETRLTVQQISNQLLFTDQAYFGAYFKRLCGMSPKAFRLSHK